MRRRLGRLVGAKSNQDLIELDIIEHHDRALGGEPFRHCSRGATMAFHHVGDARAAEMLDHRPLGAVGVFFSLFATVTLYSKI